MQSGGWITELSRRRDQQGLQMDWTRGEISRMTHRCFSLGSSGAGGVLYQDGGRAVEMQTWGGSCSGNREFQFGCIKPEMSLRQPSGNGTSKHTHYTAGDRVSRRASPAIGVDKITQAADQMSNVPMNCTLR